MNAKKIRHGNHIMNNNTDGYIYSLSVTKSTDFNSHIHKCYEFIHIIQGELLYTVEGSEYMLSSGDLIMTNPEELHSFSFPKDGLYEREFLHIYPGFIDKYTDLVKALNSRKLGYFNHIPAQIVEKYGIDIIFNEIKDCCEHIEPETDNLVLGNTIRLISRISQILRKEIPAKPNTAIGGKTNAVCKYIDNHYKENITAKSIAEYMFISPSHLSRIFKRDTGMSVRVYLNMRRITRAKNLIVQGQESIKNIYWKCGFEDYSTFYRCFVKYAGMSPEEFRKSQNSI